MGKLTNLTPPTTTQIMVVGTVKSTAGDTGVLHGITTGTIVCINCTVWDTALNRRIPPGFVNTTYDYFVYTTSTHFIIYVPGSGANSGGVMGKPFNALLTYTTT